MNKRPRLLAPPPPAPRLVPPPPHAPRPASSIFQPPVSGLPAADELSTLLSEMTDEERLACHACEDALRQWHRGHKQLCREQLERYYPTVLAMYMDLSTGRRVQHRLMHRGRGSGCTCIAASVAALQCQQRHQFRAQIQHRQYPGTGFGPSSSIGIIRVQGITEIRAALAFWMGVQPMQMLDIDGVGLMQSVLHGLRGDLQGDIAQHARCPNGRRNRSNQHSRARSPACTVPCRGLPS